MLEETGDGATSPHTHISNEFANGALPKDTDSGSFSSIQKWKENPGVVDEHCDIVPNVEKDDSDLEDADFEKKFIFRKNNTYPQFVKSEDPLRKNPLTIDYGVPATGKRLLPPIEKNDSKRYRAFSESTMLISNGADDLSPEASLPHGSKDQIPQSVLSTVLDEQSHISDKLPASQPPSSSGSESSIIKNDRQDEIELKEYLDTENLNGKFIRSMKLQELRSSSPTNSISSMPVPSSAKEWYIRNDDDRKSVASDSFVIRYHADSNKRGLQRKFIRQPRDNMPKASLAEESEEDEDKDDESDDGLQFFQVSHSNEKLEDDSDYINERDAVSPLYPSDRCNSIVEEDESVSTLKLTQSSGILPAIPSHKTRERSYLVGNLTKHGSLLGVDELHRYFPDRMLKVFVGTWNMQRKTIPKNLDDFLLPKHQEYLQDIYVIGVQESTQDQKMWEVKLQETLGVNHVLAHSVSHGVLHLSVFVRRDLIWFCSLFEDDKVTTRMVSQLKTKGATAIGFHFFGTSLLFVNSHFHSGESKVKERVEDYCRIREKIKIPRQRKYDAHKTADVTSRYDCVFWFGDLNFRVNLPLQIIHDEVNDPESMNLKEVLKGDQLMAAMKRGRIFEGFQEPAIKFRPTYKFLPGSDQYAAQPKLRTPSYTDRILFKCKENSSITCSEYNSVPKLRKSDHRPVIGFFEVCLKPGRENIPGLVKFRGDVYEKAARLRAQGGNYENTSSVCNIL